MINVVILVFVIIIFALLGCRLYMSGARCRSNASLEGKTAVVTGANCGIGLETARDFYKRGARVYLACRDVNRGRVAANDIGSEPGGEVLVAELDLASFDSIRTFCDRIKQEESSLDILVNNAGVFYHPYAMTVDGLEMHMGVNHFGHFLLTNLLVDLLKKATSSRVVIVSSMLYTSGKIHFIGMHSVQKFSPWYNYCNSKLANALFCREFPRRYEGTGINIYCTHPGAVRTNAGRHFMPYWLIVITGFISYCTMKTPVEGAQTVVHCAVSEELKEESGYYYSECKMTPWSGPACDDGVAKKLWELSEKTTGLTM